MSYFNKRYHPPGTAPGTLTSEAAHGPISIKIIDYTDTDLTELVISDARDSRPYLEKESITWIQVQGIVDAKMVKTLGNLFGLYPLALEDVINTGQRPKADSYDVQLFIVMNLPTVGKTMIPKASRSACF